MRLPLELVERVQALGFDVRWSAEACESDATSPLADVAAPLADVAAVTTRIRLGTSILRLPGRPRAMAAMDVDTGT